MNVATEQDVSSLISYFKDLDLNDGTPEPDLIINHLNQNHYSSDNSSDSEVDHPSEPIDLQENHTPLEPPALLHQDEEENGQGGELLPGSDGVADRMLMEEQPPRFLSPSALKKHIHVETTKVNNELRTLITKEIRKPGRRMYPRRVGSDEQLILFVFVFKPPEQTPGIICRRSC